MAVESERPARATGWREGIADLARRLRQLVNAETLSALGREIVQRPPISFFTSSLLRRIFVSNLLGLVILLGGIAYLSQHNAWLIDAKRDSLEAQANIIAIAIAANAQVDTDRIVLDPDKLPDTEGARIPFRDDGFAALELSIRPEVVTPVLRKLVQTTNNRARIYDREGILIVDSTQLLSRGQIAHDAAVPPPETGPKTKSFWTRAMRWYLRSELQVYRDIGSANGKLYPEVRMALQGSPTPFVILTAHGEQVVSYAVPIQARNRAVQGVLLLSTEPGEIDDALVKQWRAILQIALVAFAVAIAVSILLARTVAGPMRRLSAAADHVSHDIKARHDLPDFSHRADEVGQLAGAFRSMTAALIRRIEASEKFAADVAHELKNPLTAARSTAESLAYAKTEEQRQQLMGQIQGELKRLNRLITDVSNASRLDAELALQHTAPLDLTLMLEGLVATFRDLLSGTGKSLALAVAPSPLQDAYVVEGHEGRLAQVMTNLLDNAISFSPEGGRITLRARRDGKFVEVSVEDEGPGISEDKLEMIFDRFYTYRPQGSSSRGTNSGLGLSISREIIRAHRGEVWAANINAQTATGERGPQGARFVVRLPAAGTLRGVRSRRA
jgi:two-component system sensor histidine kinase ChvG